MVLAFVITRYNPLRIRIEMIFYAHFAFNMQRCYSYHHIRYILVFFEGFIIASNIHNSFSTYFLPFTNDESTHKIILLDETLEIASIL